MSGTFTVKYMTNFADMTIFSSYNNGSSGVGATLTNNSTLQALSVDFNTPSVNDRILVTAAMSPAYFGIYVVTTVGNGSTPWVLTRSSDYDTSGQISQGDIIEITNGTYNGGYAVFQSLAGSPTMGTSPLCFVPYVFSNTVSNICADSICVMDTTNQIELGTTHITTINSVAPAANRLITIPDALANSNTVLSTESTVTQLTSISTGVSITGSSGAITTVSLTTAASTTAGTFVVTNPFYTSSSQIIMVRANFGSSTTGTPYAFVSATTPGSNTFSITVRNIDTSAALNGTLIINFLVC